jgi:glutathione peroxidase
MAALIACAVAGGVGSTLSPPLEELIMIRSLLAALAASVTFASPARAEAPPSNDQAPDDPTQVMSFTMERLEGGEEDLSAYQGKVVLIVNTASKCGLTSQYEGLQELYETYKDQGFVILGFPANNFMSQEPGSDEEIAQFCERNYGVTFPMFSKISVKGSDQHPLYAKLTSAPEPIGGEVKWNFQKYLVDPSGHVVAKFSPRTKPLNEQVTGKIEELLQQQN